MASFMASSLSFHLPLYQYSLIAVVVFLSKERKSEEQMYGTVEKIRDPLNFSLNLKLYLLMKDIRYEVLQIFKL